MDRRLLDLNRALYRDATLATDSRFCHWRNPFAKANVGTATNATSAVADRNRDWLHPPFWRVRGILGGLHL